MPDMKNLSDMYVEELQDLWSANDQMKKVVKDMADAAGDAKLGDRLRQSVEGIQTHTEQLKELLESAGGEMDKEHCKGMEGLVREARKHALEEDLDEALRDVAIIAQFQRMCHYGLAGFGTARAFAEALGKDEDARLLQDMLKRIHESDDYMSELAMRSKNIDAAAA